ncbi:MAG: hypothetical protein OQJ78_01095, partial [Ignavibacteriaceae bacterium]|nr:hypothetical protein [Ignavibacteriaceae bacterium]
MKHQYRTKGFWKKSIQQFVDFFIDLYAKIFVDKNVSEEYEYPQNILFISLGHLGDALIGSYLFPLIRERYPNAQIDVLAGEWCKPVLQNNPYVRKLIYFNHFRMNRSEISWWKKIRIHIMSSRSTLKIICSQHYNLSIEGRISHPNGNLFCYRGNIKRRIGFGSGGFGSLLTEEVPLSAGPDCHFLQAELEALKKIGINKKLEDIRPYFFISEKLAKEKHPFESYFRESFLVIHPESGYPLRMMSEEFWLSIIKKILEIGGNKIFLCGTSTKSIELYNFLLSNIPNAKENIINTVQRLSIDEFYLLTEHAKLAITIESLPSHLCSINCKTISFYKDGAGSLFFP